MAELDSVIGNTAELSDGNMNDVLELHGEINYGSSGSGTSDYNELLNKPSINGVIVQGNLTTVQLGIKNGENGEDGFSPTITQEPNSSGYQITITNADGQTRFQLLNGRNGANGKSAYISAIDAGFQGTEEEWLKSLKGKDGVDGKSAYDVAVENGFVGSEEDWLKSLKGKDGLLLDAPSDGKTYGRNNEQWVEITDSGGSKIEDAPADGKAYARKDGAWVQSVQSSDVYTKSQADEQFLPSSTSIPSKTSDLTNDSGFITSASVPSKTSDLTNDSGFLTEIPDEYVTGTEMSEYAQPKGDYALKSELFSKSYNDLTDKPTIPTTLSQLTNDSGFITAIPEEYVTDTEMNEYAQPKGDYALRSELFSKSYNDLTDKPTIPTSVSQLTNDAGFITQIPDEYVTSTEMNEYAQPKGDYALKSELFSKSYNDLTDKPTIPSKTSELTNDAGFLTAIPEEYATKAYLDEKIGNIDAILDSINGEVI